VDRIVRTVERKGEVMQTAPARHSTLRAAAQSLSLRNVDQAACELMSEALNRLTLLAYERGDDGQLCNVDPANGRLLIPLPWGRGGFTKWGLRPSEANIFRLIMFTRQRRGVPLYFYDRSRRCWYLNLNDYPQGSTVIAQLKEWQIAIGEYREARSQILASS
jgi:hypothetical protein